MSELGINANRIRRGRKPIPLSVEECEIMRHVIDSGLRAIDRGDRFKVPTALETINCGMGRWAQVKQRVESRNRPFYAEYQRMMDTIRDKNLSDTSRAPRGPRPVAQLPAPPVRMVMTQAEWDAKHAPAEDEQLGDELEELADRFPLAEAPTANPTPAVPADRDRGRVYPPTEDMPAAGPGRPQDRAEPGTPIVGAIPEVEPVAALLRALLPLNDETRRRVLRAASILLGLEPV